MKMMTYKITSVAMTCAALLPAKALDTTVSNEFWCTWNYVNPKVETAAPVLATDFNAWCFALEATCPLKYFSSFPATGILITIR